MSATAPNGAPDGVADLRTLPAPTLRFRMARDLAQGWWLFLLRGIAGILFGLYAFFAPGLGLVVILGVLAAWLALDGAFSLWHAATGRPVRPGAAPTRGGRLWLALEGLLLVAAAAMILLDPIRSALALTLVVGALMGASGVMRIILAVRTGSWLLGLSGLLGVLVGLWLVLVPGAGLLALIWIVAIQAAVAGIMLVALSLRLRRINNDPTPG